MRVGPYDDLVMPALMLFDGGKERACNGSASRHFYDPREKYPGQFDRDDLYYTRIRFGADSMMLRPGYKVILYEKPKFQGLDAYVNDKGETIPANYEVIEGAWAEGSDEGRLKCQPIKNRVIAEGYKKQARSKTGIGSFKIMKQEQGKATGYWKGITSTGSQEFTYTVGISSKDSS